MHESGGGVASDDTVLQKGDLGGDVVATIEARSLDMEQQTVQSFHPSTTSRSRSPRVPRSCSVVSVLLEPSLYSCIVIAERAYCTEVR